jgi:hypothetical protein
MGTRKDLKQDTKLEGKQGRKKEEKTAMKKDTMKDVRSGQRDTRKGTAQEGRW